MLSLVDKLNIIEQSDKVVMDKQLAEIYGVGQSKISGIKRRKRKFLNFGHSLKTKMDVLSEN